MNLRDRLCYAIASPDVQTMPIAWTGATAEICRALAGYGYRAVEVQVRDPAGFDTKGFWETVVENGLALVGLSTGPVTAEGLTLSAADPTVRRGALDRLKSITDLAAEYGATVALGSVRGGSAGAGSPAAAVSHFRSALETLVAYAQGTGVTYLLEPQSRSVTDLFNTATAALEFAAEFPATAVALELDTFHIAAEESSSTLPYRQAWQAGRLAHVQLGDTDRAVPGDGGLPWAEILRSLDELGYSGWLSVECRQDPSGTAAAARAASFLNRIAAVVGAERREPS